MLSLLEEQKFSDYIATLIIAYASFKENSRYKKREVWFSLHPFFQQAMQEPTLHIKSPFTSGVLILEQCELRAHDNDG